MALPGLSKEDGSGLIAFEEIPDSGSSDARQTHDRIRHQLQGRDNSERLVFHYTMASKRRWAFSWSAITTTFADALQTFAGLRRCLFYPDTANLANEYRVKVQQTRLPLRQTAGGELDLPEGSTVLVTLLNEEEPLFWSRISQIALDKIWDNAGDDVYAELLKE